MKGEKHLKVKTKYNEALKLYDNKDYKSAKRACDKILDKDPDHADTLALKGLLLTNLSEKSEGEKLIKEALQKNLKNPTVWHFYALYYKQEKNYQQAMKSYKMALIYDPTNFIILRDLNYLQLQLRQINAFIESAKKGLDLKSGMSVNWITYSVANYLNGNFALALKVAEMCVNMNEGNLKKNEKHEIIMYQAKLLGKQNKINEEIEFLNKNQSSVIDKTLYNEYLFEAYLKTKNREKSTEIAMRLLESNSENLNFFLYYFQAHGFDFKTFSDLLEIKDENVINELLTLLSKLKALYKSKLIPRIELAISTSENFKTHFKSHLYLNIKQNIPSIFFSIKFIYKYQPHKIKLIEEILDEFLEKADKKEKVKINEELELDFGFLPNLIWIYFYASQHFDFKRESERALTYINKSIDITPSYVEFYMIKSKIFKHAFMFNESISAYDKARKLDLSDRYLNAKYSKALVRNDLQEKSLTSMKEFVRDPLSEDYVDYIQCMWFEIETADSYLRSRNILEAHRLYSCVLNHFNTFIEDQMDFHNFCLRRYMINDFILYLEYMDRVIDHHFISSALQGLLSISDFIEKNKDHVENEIKLKIKDNENYKFKESSKLKTEIENEVYNLVKKLQTLSKNEFFHYLAVKESIKRDKVLPALKSLIYLSKNTSSTHYLNALNIFEKYLRNGKVNQNYLNIIHAKLPFLKTQQDSKKESDVVNENIVKSQKIVKFNILLNNFKNEIEIEKKNKEEELKKLEEKLKELSPVEARSVSFKDLNDAIIFINVNFTDDSRERIKSFIYDLSKIKCEDKDINGNLGFYV